MRNVGRGNTDQYYCWFKTSTGVWKCVPCGYAGNTGSKSHRFLHFPLKAALALGKYIRHFSDTQQLSGTYMTIRKGYYTAQKRKKEEITNTQMSRGKVLRAMKNNQGRKAEQNKQETRDLIP